MRLWNVWPWSAPVPPVASLGARGEQLAALEYVRRGYRILARNEFNKKGKRIGELDLIAVSRQQIIFVEVKTRTVGSDRFGSAAEAVTASKQRRVLRAAQYFLAHHPQYHSLRPQVDVCVVLVDPVDTEAFSVTIIENSVDDLT